MTKVYWALKRRREDRAGSWLSEPEIGPLFFPTLAPKVDCAGNRRSEKNAKI